MEKMWISLVHFYILLLLNQLVPKIFGVVLLKLEYWQDNKGFRRNKTEIVWDNVLMYDDEIS